MAKLPRTHEGLFSYLRVGKVELLVQVVGVGDEAASLLQHISGRAAVTSKLIAKMVNL